jgi:coatomer protein complex subunit alpha (xenin)
MPHLAPQDYQLRFVDQPFVAIGISTLQKMYSRGIELTTKGDFSSALVAFRQCLQHVPLIVVTSDSMMKSVEQMVKRLVEYITAMRIELERKRLVAEGSEDIKRVTELSCYMTLCGMDNAHKFLAYKNAMNGNYKIKNFISAAHFARLVLELESTGIFASKPDVIAQHKKYFQAFQQKGTNAHVLNFNQSLNMELNEISGYLCIGSLKPFEDSHKSH